MTVVGEMVLRSMVFVVGAGVACGDEAVPDGSAACGAAETAASVLTAVRFAQNARARSESVSVVGKMALIAVVLSAHVACIGVTSAVVCPVVCGPADAAVLADLSAFFEFPDDSSAWRLIWTLLSAGFCCPVGRVVGWLVS